MTQKYTAQPPICNCQKDGSRCSSEILTPDYVSGKLTSYAPPRVAKFARTAVISAILPANSCPNRLAASLLRHDGRGKSRSLTCYRSNFPGSASAWQNRESPH